MKSTQVVAKLFLLGSASEVIRFAALIRSTAGGLVCGFGPLGSHFGLGGLLTGLALRRRLGGWCRFGGGCLAGGGAEFWHFWLFFDFSRVCGKVTNNGLRSADRPAAFCRWLVAARGARAEPLLTLTIGTSRPLP